MLLYKISKHDKLENHASTKTDLQKFFSTPPSTLPIVQQIAATIQKQQQRHRFIPSLVSRIGFPQWDKTAFVPSAQAPKSQSRSVSPIDSLAFIPFVKEGQEKVAAFLLCRRVNADSFTIKIYYANSYAALPFNVASDSLGAESLAVQVMKLQNAVFGHSFFKITDKRLFAATRKGSANAQLYFKPASTKTTQVSGRLSGFVEAEQCGWVWMQPGQLVGVAPDESPDYGHEELKCTTYMVWISDIHTAEVEVREVPEAVLAEVEVARQTPVTWTRGITKRACPIRTV